MNCNKREDELIGYLIDALSNEEKKHLELHLISCPKCKQKLENFKKSRSLLHAWNPFVPPSDHEQFKHKIMENITAQRLIEEKISQKLILETIDQSLF